MARARICCRQNFLLPGGLLVMTKPRVMSFGEVPLYSIQNLHHRRGFCQYYYVNIPKKSPYVKHFTLFATYWKRTSQGLPLGALLAHHLGLGGDDRVALYPGFALCLLLHFLFGNNTNASKTLVGVKE